MAAAPARDADDVVLLLRAAARRLPSAPQLDLNLLAILLTDAGATGADDFCDLTANEAADIWVPLLAVPGATRPLSTRGNAGPREHGPDPFKLALIDAAVRAGIPQYQAIARVRLPGGDAQTTKKNSSRHARRAARGQFKPGVRAAEKQSQVAARRT